MGFFFFFKFFFAKALSVRHIGYFCPTCGFCCPPCLFDCYLRTIKTPRTTGWKATPWLIHSHSNLCPLPFSALIIATTSLINLSHVHSWKGLCRQILTILVESICKCFVDLPPKSSGNPRHGTVTVGSAENRILFLFAPTLRMVKWWWGYRKDISHCFGSVTLASGCRKLSVRSFGKLRFTSQSKTTHRSARSDYSLSDKLSIVLVSQDNVNVNLCFLSSHWISRLPRKKTQNFPWKWSLPWCKWQCLLTNCKKITAY